VAADEAVYPLMECKKYGRGFVERRAKLFNTVRVAAVFERMSDSKLDEKRLDHTM